MKIVLVLLTSLTFVVWSRIECDWGTEFLCGDKCLGKNKDCLCGNGYFGYKDDDYYCCKEPNTFCEKNVFGNIECEGQILWWNQPCNGTCTQDALSGDTMLLCADQKQCYREMYACQGTPLCKE